MTTQPDPNPYYDGSMSLPANPTDTQALNYLAGTVLGDIASTPEYVVDAAKRAVEATGRTIDTISGD